MILRVSTALVIVSAVGCALAGCSTDHDRGDGGPIPFPERPVQIKVDAISPCSTLSQEQRKQLGVNAAEADDTLVNGQRSPGCGYLTTTGFDYNTQTIPVGADTARSAPGAEIIQINGFGAVRDPAEASLSPRSICQVSIDAAPGQTVRVQAAAAFSGPQPMREELCLRATDVASMVMTTVVATASR